MPLHLVKLAVGCATPEELADWQGERIRAGMPLIHRTRHMPRLAAEILQGGSLYWVFKGFIRARQPIIDLEKGADDEGHGFCRIHFAPDIVRTQPVPYRPFQGWRYLPPEKAPDDIAEGGAEIDAIPEALTLELQRLGLA